MTTYLRLFFFYGSTAPSGPGLPLCRRFTITFKHTKHCRIPLDELSADLTTHNPYKRQTSMLPAGFEPAIPASERPQNDVLDRAVTGFGHFRLLLRLIMSGVSIPIDFHEAVLNRVNILLTMIRLYKRRNVTFWTRHIHKKATYILCLCATRERQSTQYSAGSFTLQPSIYR